MTDKFRNLTSDQQKEVIEEVKRQVAVANAEEFIARMTKKCFVQCVTKPGTALGSSEKRCTAMCMDRFIDSWNLIMRAYVDRINQEAQQQSPQ